MFESSISTANEYLVIPDIPHDATERTNIERDIELKSNQIEIGETFFANLLKHRDIP